MAGDARQQRHGPQRLAARGEAGHAFAETDHRGLRRAVHRGQRLDVLDLEAGDLGSPRRGELRQDVAFDGVEAQRLVRDVVAVGALVAHQHVHDAERQGCIGADPDRQIEVGRLGAARAARIDHHDLDAALLALLFGECPEMHVGGGEVGAPRDHQVGMDDILGVGAAHGAECHVPRCLAAGVAHRAGLQARGAERMEQAVHEAAVHQALVGGVGVAEQGERAAFLDDRFPLGGDLVERLVPGDGLELARAFGAGPLQRRPDAFGRVNEIGVAVHFSASEARRVGLVGIALDAHNFTVLDMCDQRAHVGAIVGANDSNLLHRTVSPNSEDGTVSEEGGNSGLTSSWQRP